MTWYNHMSDSSLPSNLMLRKTTFSSSLQVRNLLSWRGLSSSRSSAATLFLTGRDNWRSRAIMSDWDILLWPALSVLPLCGGALLFLHEGRHKPWWLKHGEWWFECSNDRWVWINTLNEKWKKLQLISYLICFIHREKSHQMTARQLSSDELRMKWDESVSHSWFYRDSLPPFKGTCHVHMEQMRLNENELKWVTIQTPPAVCLLLFIAP